MHIKDTFFFKIFLLFFRLFMCSFACIKLSLCLLNMKGCKKLIRVYIQLLFLFLRFCLVATEFWNHCTCIGFSSCSLDFKEMTWTHIY